MRFLLDSNFLMLIGKFKIDIFLELKHEFGSSEFYTLNLVLKELETVSGGRGKNAAYAKLAMKQLKKEKVKVLKVEGKKTDKAIETVSKENCFAVCTQDKELIRRLKLGGIKSVYLLLRNRKMAVI